MVRSPLTRFRLDSPFTAQQSTFIILKYGELKSVVSVMRAFRKEFYPNNPRYVPNRKIFERVVQRFKSNASVRPNLSLGSPPSTAQDIARVKNFFLRNKKAHIRQAVVELGMGFGTIWKILRKVLKWKAYRPHLAQVLSPANKESRLAACTFWLTFAEDWFEQVLWSDEKWFVLEMSPNKQTNRFWAPVNPYEVVECKKAHGKKVMAWVGIVDGRILPIVWFEGSVNSKVYLERVLQGCVWPAVRGLATRRQYWFQQDGASCHVTAECLDFLQAKFGDRIISRNTPHHWPPYSPDLSPLDFSFWGQALAHVERIMPSTIQDLKNIVEDFAANLEPDKIRKMVRHTRKRAAACVAAQGGHFEHILSKK